jgi:hypothetical protein
MSETITCEWYRQANGDYVTGCQQRRDEFLGGSTVRENNYFYCPYCGEPIEAKQEPLDGL